ncbi:transcription factor [Datura stramonium]|uniref:Transcription factor n=1 Tax=Datura stramonium TaxID=4076 RepID=A0ABS8STM6_DATST|nr:transcription factor [Datura stramonium]
MEKQWCGGVLRSARDEDDEEALKWAALEKLPTFDRLRKKGRLCLRSIKVADEDKKFLLKLKNRVDRVGIDLPSIEVRYEHLNIEADAYAGSRALPTFLNFMTNFVETLLNSLHILPSKKRQITILKNVSGIVKPCRMTLLLGPPSSGKTTLLLALAEKLDPALKMLAELSRREKAANIKPDPDIDIYMKAAATEGQEANVVTDYVLKILGLDICADTMVGDEMIKALFMDEISTGLDSSTTFSIVNSLRQSVQLLKGTAVISLLQPAPETYNLFDDIILLSDGYIVYQGPREAVLDFFESMGFKCPERKGTADFLQEVTSRRTNNNIGLKE